MLDQPDCAEFADALDSNMDSDSRETTAGRLSGEGLPFVDDLVRQLVGVVAGPAWASLCKDNPAGLDRAG